ncbi:MAG TPA: HEAT repeat domain-containing protein, partial [Polyangia bacterium]|nr:HEAT repeat domain-containing protein [Polyangia bacterium]
MAALPDPGLAAPAKTELRAAETAAGALELRDGATTLATIPLTTPPLRRGPVSVRDLAVEGHRVAEVRLPVRGQASEEVWIGDLTARPPRVIFSGLSGPRDSDGEVSVLVQVTPDRIFEYQTSALVSRCDDQPVRLFPRAWDFGSGKFRPVLSTPPAPAKQKLVARRDDPAMPAGRPLGGYHFVAASTTAAAGADARGLASPTALDDGDPKTVWTEGLGGDGRGEFLTARATAGAYHVRGVRIVPGDASTPAAFKARNRLKSILLALGPAPEQQFDVEFPEDPAAASGKTAQAYWVALPAPVETSCATVVIRDVYRGSEATPHGGGGTTAVADLELFTELDDAGGVGRLIADTGAGVDCEAKVPLLARLGEAGVAPLSEAIAKASGAGRQCLVQALARLDGAARNPAALQALSAALIGASDAEEKLIAPVFAKAIDAPTEPLLATLLNTKASDDDRARAARVLGTMAGPEATDALITAVGSGSPALRLEIVQALGRSRNASVAKVASALAAARAEVTSTPARVGDLIRALPALGRRAPAEAEAVRQALRAALAAPATFEIRARTIMAAGATGSPELASDLAKVVATSDDPVLRHLAARELAGLAAPVSLETLRRALNDPDPRVRETAADGLGTLRDAAAEPLLIAGAKQEDWPIVRRAEIEALGRLCGVPGRDLLIRAVEKDVDDVRRAALVGLTRCKDPRAASVLLQVMKSRRMNGSLRELSAALLGELREPRAAKPLADLVSGLVNEAEGDLAVEAVVVAALRSLTRLGGPDAAAVAATLARDARHPYRQVAIEV